MVRIIFSDLKTISQYSAKSSISGYFYLLAFDIIGFLKQIDEITSNVTSELPYNYIKFKKILMY